MLKRGLWTREYVSQIQSSGTISIFLVTHQSGKSQENSYRCYPWRKTARFSPGCTLLPRYGMTTKTSSSSTKTRPVHRRCHKWEVWELEQSLTWHLAWKTLFQWKEIREEASHRWTSLRTKEQRIHGLTFWWQRSSSQIQHRHRDEADSVTPRLVGVSAPISSIVYTQIAFTKDIRPLSWSMEEMGNPFAKYSSDLLVRDSRDVMNKADTIGQI